MPSWQVNCGGDELSTLEIAGEASQLEIDWLCKLQVFTPLQYLSPEMNEAIYFITTVLRLAFGGRISRRTSAHGIRRSDRLR